MDGTLIDSMPMVLRAFAHAANPYHVQLTEDEWRRKLGGPPERILQAVLGNSVQAASALTRLVEYIQLHEESIVAFEGMETLLGDFSRVGLPVGLWTGRDRRSTAALLQRHRIRNKLTECVCGDDLASHKPDPTGLLEVLRRLQLRVEESYLVGDSEVDVLAGASVGVRTLLITHGLKLDTRVVEQAWCVVREPGEAYEVLRKEFATPSSPPQKIA